MTKIVQCAALLVALGTGSAMAEGKQGIPLEDGLYAQKVTKEYCSNRDKGYAISEGFYVEILKSGQVFNFYESECSVRNVKRQGSRVSFRCVGSSEGEPSSSNERIEIVGTDGFRYARSGQVYKKCDR